MRLAQREMLALIAFAALRISASAHAQPGHTQVLTTARAVHDLPISQAARSRVKLEGTITYYDGPELILFLQDATGGVFINVDRVYPFHAGERLSVEGIAKGGFRVGVAPNAKMRVLGEGASPDSIPATYAALASGAMDSRLVSVQGLVRDAVIEEHAVSHSKSLHMDLSLPGGRAEVYVKNYEGIDPLSLSGATIQLNGVAGGAFDAKEQMDGVVLYAADGRNLHVLSRPASALAALPLTRIGDLFATMQVEDHSPRVHVRGTLTYYASGDTAVLENGGKSLLVQTRETKNLAIGDVVDAYGFVDNHQYSPSLVDTVLVPAGSHQQSAAHLIDYASAMSGVYSDQLVSIQGKLLSEIHTEESQSLSLDVQGHVIRALMLTGEKLPEVAPGSEIQVSGICRILAGGPWREPVVFSLTMRSGNDVVIVHAPSWWTVRHLALLLSVLLGVVTIVAIWALILKQRVTRQAKIIDHSMRIVASRSEILRLISGNEGMETILKAMAAAIESLLPGVLCTYRWHGIESTQRYTSTTKAVRIPLVHADKTAGEFAAFGSSSHTPAQRNDVLLMLHEVLDLALQHHSLHENLLHHSTHDSLTKLPNRRFFEDHLGDSLTKALASATPLAIIYVDVDAFKLVNDQFGHHIGDLYLQAISLRLLYALRTGDTVARLGGDEFVVILPHTGVAEAQAFLHRLERCFVDPFMLEGHCIEGSASFGLACVPDHASTREDLKRHADRAMYRNKRRADSAAANLSAQES
ncbi:diguanylate cyclase [Acidipila sp. EB88]|uniref:GGDEF domain-containing protein n=1 Tax=Acidipila sp. EB88 TaxID=2305226 RepID=UPI000F5FAEBD|nr:GGDEF domain-containing protein [Acidipila sp. EB88]RRA49780.1 GGDEF domain-containing protein [Acidipila sp. EB88]